MKSPLRYPGGKSRVAKQIADLIPHDTETYAEPFLGGGSVLLEVAKRGRIKRMRGANVKHEWIEKPKNSLNHFFLNSQYTAPEAPAVNIDTSQTGTS